MKEKAANIQRGDLNVLQEAWKRIPENCLQKLQEGLAQRRQAFLFFRNKGGHSGY